jgi:hypothetical protein
MILFSSRLGLFVTSSAAKDQVESLEKVMPMEKTLGHRVGMAPATPFWVTAASARDRQNKRAEFEGGQRRLKLALNASLGREDAMAYAYRELVHP